MPQDPLHAEIRPVMTARRLQSFMPGVALLRLAALCLLGLITACSSSVVSTLEQRPQGRNHEVRGWVTTATTSGPRHKVRLTVELDPAKYMGWARTNTAYRVVLDVVLEGPGEFREERVLMIPVSELRQVGEDKSRNRLRMAYEPAGTLLSSGFRRLEPFDLMSFKPEAGEYRLTIRLRVLPGANRNALWTLRTLRVELLSSTDQEGLLSDWEELPPEGVR